jgi:hypothetical protein
MRFQPIDTTHALKRSAALYPLKDQKSFTFLAGEEIFRNPRTATCGGPADGAYGLDVYGKDLQSVGFN